MANRRLRLKPLATAGFAPPRPGRPARRGLPGQLSSGDFLRGVLESVRQRLPSDMQHLEARQQGSLIKFFGNEPLIHFELWLHPNRGRVELGLHFETRDADRNQRLLEDVSEELLFLKDAVGSGLEAEPWDKGWTRVYLTRPIQRLDPDTQTELAIAFAKFIQTLEPIRQAAVTGS